MNKNSREIFLRFGSCPLRSWRSAVGHVTVLLMVSHGEVRIVRQCLGVVLTPLYPPKIDMSVENGLFQ